MSGNGRSAGTIARTERFAEIAGTTATSTTPCELASVAASPRCTRAAIGASASREPSELVRAILAQIS